ncbi:MAG: glutamate racemase [bacterium]|nr:glutamate racemase [bacterium]
MKIGVFDSGLGGLITIRAIIEKLPKYDYLYLGDTARVPYGNRSQETIYRFAEEAVSYLFRQNCGLVIIACGTASANALRLLQQQYLPKNYPDRRILGVIIPLAEETVKITVLKRVGILATKSTVSSSAFVREITKLSPKIRVFQQAAPLLVPLIENNGLKWIKPILKEYLCPLLARRIDTLVLGCTHYPLLKKAIREVAGSAVSTVSPDEIIPVRLADYLTRHPEMENRLDKASLRQYCITDLTEGMAISSKKLFGKNIKLERITIENT